MNALALYYKLNNNNIINIHAIINNKINNKINKIHISIIILYNIYMYPTLYILK